MIDFVASAVKKTNSAYPVWIFPYIILVCSLFYFSFFLTFIFSNHHTRGYAIKIVPLFSLHFGCSVMLHIFILLLKLC